MTGTGEQPPITERSLGKPGVPVSAPGDDATCHQAAARIRDQRSDWVVVWVARMGRFRAYPLFRAPSGTSATAQTAEDLTAQMDRIEQAARKPRGRSPHTGPAAP
jgi:hypothetical protein